MKCPNCKEEIRSAEKLEQRLVANRCLHCGGHWVSSFQYWRWRDLQPEPPAPTPPGTESPATDNDSRDALLCAECGRILRKYRIARDIPFRVDHCGHCGGMWFDAGEWRALREQGLHANVHNVFTAVWQRELRREDSRATYERLYEERFGPDGYAELQRVRAWLDAQPEKAAMLRFLTDPEPFGS